MRKPDKIERLYIDFDAFFANVEKQLDPRARTRPVGVTSLPSEQATLITCCYMAKAFGVKRGMRVFEARSLCPNIVIKPARHDVYVDIHNRILAEIERHVPVTKVWSIDEAECILIGRESRECEALAERIRAGLAANIGPVVTPSIGLAPNQFLAKVAAEMNKPNGLTIIRPEDLPGPLMDLKLRDLPGISSGMETRLNRAGIVSVEDFWEITAKHARAIWGNVEGERMWAQLHGYAISRPATTRRMFGHSRMLSGDWQRPAKAFDCLRLLTVKAAYRMRREGYTAGAMSVSCRINGGMRTGKDTRFAACADDHSLTVQMQAIYRDIVDACPKSVRFGGVSVMLHDIVPKGRRTGDMFNDNTANAAAQKWEKVTAAMDGLNEKNGACVVHLGPRAQMPGGYAGAKIAFGRVPDKSDFY